MKKNNEKFIYIVLVKALTGLGKFARIFSNYEYTHIAICLDDNINDFITFSRKYHYSPFDSGFMHETLDCYAFGNNEKVKLKIFKVPISEQSLTNIKEYIKKIENDDEYIFNLYSMITMPIFHGFKVYKSHNCMTFVSKMLDMTDTIKLEKKYYKYSIKDLDLLLTNYLWKEEEFKKEKEENENYMNKISLIKNINLFLSLNIKLISRIIKRNDGNE